MLEAIKHIGELERSKARSELDTSVKDLGAKKKYSHILLITFEVKAGVVTRYLGTDLEEIDSSRRIRYLYRGGAPNGADVTPTSYITEPQKTIHKKLDRWIQKNADSSKDPFFSSLAAAYHGAHDHIVKDVLELYQARSDKKRDYALTFLFNDDGTTRYIGDYERFQAFVFQKAAAPGKVRRENHVCSICGKEKLVVYGDVIPGKTLKFYTLDKPGYIASGFRKGNSWKNFPVCQDCAMDLEAGTMYVDKHLNFTLGGARYYLIPKPIIENKTILKRILGEFQIYEKTLASTSEDGEKKATAQEKFEATRNAERFAINTMGKQSPAVSFDLLFYDKPHQGTAFKILQHIQDVAPGRATLLVNTMTSVDKSPIFDSALPGGDGGRRSIQFSFSWLAEFFKKPQFFKKPNSKTDQTWKQEYLAIVADIFTGAPVGKDYILHQIMQKLHVELLNDVYNNHGKTFSFEEWTLRALNMLLFLQNCHAIATNYGEVKDMSESTEVSAQLFDGNSTVNTPAKKAIFLTGVLTQRLLNIQWQKRGSKPFFKELKGLRLKEQDVKGLFPKIINKLEEYEDKNYYKNYYAKLEQETAVQFAQAGDNWDLTIDEISFVFSLGMTLANRINKEEDNNATDKQN